MFTFIYQDNYRIPIELIYKRILSQKGEHVAIVRTEIKKNTFHYALEFDKYEAK